jgi:lysosomal acid lipase/cholesteryl ester hydrolase
MKGALFLSIMLFLMVVSADDLTKSFRDITIQYGFRFEQHIVQTDDGYLLKMFRIPGLLGKEGDASVRPPILIQHGVFDSADFVVCHGAEKSPAFWLANQGYDVWVSNSRGNKYSREHKTLNPDKDAAFWDFSFEDMVKDYQANIGYILLSTGFEKIPVIGHSQGTSSMYAGLSLIGDWFESRVTVFISLGSVARLNNLQSVLLKFLCVTPLALDTIKFLKINEIFMANFITTTSFRLLCGIVPFICQVGSAIVADADPRVDDTWAARIYFGHFPSGSSTKCLEHYIQLYNSKQYQQFDYGKTENAVRYGQSTPPQFQLKNIKVPVAKFTGNSDKLGDVTDNAWLSEQIKDVLVFDRVYDYGHLTFFIGKDLIWLSDALVVLQKYPAVLKDVPEDIKEDIRSLLE